MKGRKLKFLESGSARNISLQTILLRFELSLELYHCQKAEAKTIIIS